MAETPVHATTEAPAPHGAGGLPQFDPSWWPGQMAWFLFIFLIVYLLMWKVIVPRVGGTIAAREDRISGDIAEARRLRDQAEQQAAQADVEIAEARTRAQRMVIDAKTRAEAEAKSVMSLEEARYVESMDMGEVKAGAGAPRTLDESIAAAEARIRTAQDSAMENIQAIASDTAKAIVDKLTGKAATADELKRALSARA